MLMFGKGGSEKGQFMNPRGIAIDEQQRVYVTDATRDLVLVFNSIGGYLYSFWGPIQVGGSLYRPIGIAIGNQGKIYIADSGNDRIMVFKID
jgi:tripartite motif-containing protein 71